MTDKYNSAIKSWASSARDDIKNIVRGTSIRDWSSKFKDKYPNYRPITNTQNIIYATRKQAGEINVIRFGFPGQAIFTLLGVGRHQQARTAKDFITPALDPAGDELADIVAQLKGDQQILKILTGSKPLFKESDSINITI